jgi:ABC-type multidrug transport system ATPase subunit
LSIKTHAGLESFSALKVMQHVFELKDKTVIASIHQPRMEIFDRMSSVVLLSEGRHIYFGPPGSAVKWFSELEYVYCVGQVSVSDWLLDTVSVGFDRTTVDNSLTETCMSTIDDIQQAAEAFAAHFDGGHSTLDLEKAEGAVQAKDAQTSSKVRCPHHLNSSLNRCSNLEKDARDEIFRRWHKQFRVLLHRAFLSQIRNPTDTASRLLLATWIGLLTGESSARCFMFFLQ